MRIFSYINLFLISFLVTYSTINLLAHFFILLR